MEDLKAYMESGVLELYVLGDLSRDEKLQVEEMALKHAEVRWEIEQIERSFEGYASENEVEAPAYMRDRVLNAIFGELPAKNEMYRADAHDDIETQMTKVLTMQSRKLTNFYKYAFAASLLALIASLFALFSVYNRLQDSQAQIAGLQQRDKQYANQVNLLDNEIGVFHDPTIKLIKLQGTPKAPKSQMTLAWSAQKRKVMIDMQDMKLAETDKAHQYQLWAIVNGKPVDLGVFDSKSDTTGMKEMKPVAGATVFAVTIEPRGGSVNPTLDQMVLAAKI